jgi:predicted acylesterase/phospholipase RssA
MKSVSLVVVFGLISTSAAVCNAAAFGGGGALGAHSAGAFQAFAELLPMNVVNYSAVGGISVGSLNSLGISQYPPGEEKNASDYINTIWRSLNGNKAVYEEWPGGLVAGILFHSGLYNTQPEYDLLKKWVLKNPVRKLSQGTVEINSGEYKIYNDSLNYQTLWETTMCSSAIPVFFKNQDFNGGVYCDGGLFNMFDTAEPIKRCLEETQDQTEIFIDVFSCFRKNFTAEPNSMKTLHVFQRAFEILSYTAAFKTLTIAKQAYPKVNYRYFVEPTMNIPGFDALNFSLPIVNELLAFGYSDGQKVIQSGSNLDKVINDYKETLIYP